MIKSKHVYVSDDGLDYRVTVDEEVLLSAEQTDSLESIRYIGEVLRVANDPDLTRRVCAHRTYNLVVERVYFVGLPLEMIPPGLKIQFDNAAVQIPKAGNVSVPGRKTEHQMFFALQEIEKMVSLVEIAYLRHLHSRGQLPPSAKKRVIEDDFSL